MISNRPGRGLDLLGAMVSVATDRASGSLGDTIRIARCDAVQLKEGFAVPEVDLEAWSVSEDEQAIVVSVFATATDPGGGRTIAASGRFTFTTLTQERDCGA